MKEQQAAGGFQDSNLYRFRGIQPGEVSPAYDIFHYFKKKDKKQLMSFFIIRLLQLLAGRTRICTFPNREHHTEVSQVYGTF